MRSSTRTTLFLVVCMVAGLASCKKDDPASLLPPPTPDQSFTEEFDTTTAAYDRGWRYINVSDPKDEGWWTQGGFHNPTMWDGIYFDFAAGNPPKPIPFAPYSSKGSYPGFIAAYFNSLDAIEVLDNDTSGIISTWLISPSLTVKNGDKITFYTRSVLMPANGAGGGDSVDYGVRLQVRLSSTASLNVGNGLDPGDYTGLLLDINPEYKFHHTDPSQAIPDAYPASWTKFEATVSGVAEPRTARFAFRFFNDRWGEFIPGGGVLTASTGVAIDQVQYVSAR